jgi:hypothetical protein
LQSPPLQASAFPAAQALQAFAPVPHAMTEGVVQVLPEQHPCAQLPGLQPLQAPLPHVWGVGHASQAAPPAPHALALVPAWQKPCAQHPLHESGSQTQAPFEHRWPVPHAAPAPHWQAPAEEHVSAVEGSHAVQA